MITASLFFLRRRSLDHTAISLRRKVLAVEENRGFHPFSLETTRIHYPGAVGKR
jgi:hypothetical protein